MGFILMYDITNEESFNAVQDWWGTADCLWEWWLIKLQSYFLLISPSFPFEFLLSILHLNFWDVQLWFHYMEII